MARTGLVGGIGVGLLLGLLALCAGCRDENLPGVNLAASGPFALNETASTSLALTATAGGTISAPTGDRLVIPPGALAADTTITMVPLAIAEAADLDFFGGAHMQPDGLQFQQPATLTLQLATALPPGTRLLKAESLGPAVPRQFGSGDVPFIVDASGRTATGLISGFSAPGLMKNCHSGTRDAIFAGWTSRAGRDWESVTRATGLNPGQLTQCDLPADPLQTLLGPYFEKCGEIGREEPFDATAHRTVRETLMAGRQVVFLFAGALSIDPATGHYRNIDHSAVAVLESNGSISIRNQVYITGKDSLKQLEKTGTIVTVPLADIDKKGEGLRDMRSGEVYRRLLNLPFPPGVRERTALAWPTVALMCEKSSGIVDGGVDGGGAAPRDASVDMTAAAPDAAVTCPVTMATVGACPGENMCPKDGPACGCPPGGEFCCHPGFCYTRDIAGCTQEKCPAGAGRNYTGHCVCAETMRRVYDPCRAGFLLRCEPL